MQGTALLLCFLTLAGAQVSPLPPKGQDAPEAHPAASPETSSSPRGPKAPNLSNGNSVNIGAIIGGIAGGLLLVGLGIGAWLLRRRWSQSLIDKPYDEPQPPQMSEHHHATLSLVQPVAPTIPERS
ncbi:hypothetical protein V5O48_019438, partial [Marasmius crinis-equi]